MVDGENVQSLPVSIVGLAQQMRLQGMLPRMSTDEQRREKTAALREALAMRVQATEGGRIAQITEDVPHVKRPGAPGHMTSAMSEGSTPPSRR